MLIHQWGLFFFFFLRCCFFDDEVVVGLLYSWGQDANPLFRPCLARRKRSPLGIC